MAKRNNVKQPTVTELDVWFIEIGDKKYKLTAHRITPPSDSYKPIRYAYKFYQDEYSNAGNQSHERLSREQVEKLFEQEINVLKLA